MESPGMSVSEQFRLKREKGRRWLHKIGTIQMAQGAVCIIIGIVTLIYGSPNPTFVYYVECPIWPGIFLLVAGVLGSLAGRQEDLPGNIINPYQRKLVVANYVMTIMSWTPAVLTLTYAGLALAWCQSTDKYQQSCIYNKSENEVLALVSIVAGIIIIISTIPFMVFICMFGRSFGLRVNNTLAEPDPFMQEQMHQQANIIQQQQAEIARLAERQQIVEKQLAYGSNLPQDAPPPYDEPITDKA